jgi:ABC-2 type transport system ATP-binding protein
MTQPSDILIQADHLSRYYGPHLAVADIALTLRRGDILGLLGPNGAGKSTTMKMLTGNLKPSSGSIKVHGIDMADQPKAAKAHLGYLPEQPPLHPELTVEEYLQHCARLHRVKDVASAVTAACQDCGLEHMRQRLIGNLSKGYQQRVGIAQAIIHRPPVIILDEPTVGLDPIQILEIRSLIKGLSSNHSVILSSHILAEIQAVCSRVMIINEGRLAYADTLQNEVSESALEVAFAQPPAISVLEALPGVTTVEATATGFVLHFEQDPREALLRESLQHGWALQSLRPYRRSLEEIFVDITSR